MKIVDVVLKVEQLSDGSQGLGLRVKTDSDGPDMEFGAAAHWPSKLGAVPSDSPEGVANIFRGFAAAIEKMGQEAKAA